MARESKKAETLVRPQRPTFAEQLRIAGQALANPEDAEKLSPETRRELGLKEAAR